MRHRAVPAAVTVVVVCALAGGLLGSRVMATDDRVTSRYQAYADALAAIEQGYVEKTDAAQLVYSSIDGMLRTLDPHSSFLDPKAFAQMRERQEGHYYGIGVSIVSVNGDVTITQIFEGSPAYKSGIRRGDVIARAAGEDAKGWTTEDAVKRIKGPKGTSVPISIRRQGLASLIDLTVERDEILITTIRTAFMIQPGTGYVRLQEFSETSDTELGVALEKLKAAGMERLVLDLRDNPGGPLDQAIAVANRFLRRGQMIVYTRGRAQRSSEDYRAPEEGQYTSLPLIVMTSRQSASASEIVAGAMQDHDRGLVIGETTFGKALVQSVYPISNQAALALTTAHYYTPSDRLIQRPWDGAFDEYLTYSYREQGATRPHDPKDLKYTSAGRKVYSGGGIEPDHFIAGPVEGFAPTPFSRTLLTRGAFIDFAERFAREGDTRPAAKTATHRVAPGWQVDEAILAEFKDYLQAQHVRVDEGALQVDRAFIAAMIHYEVDNDLFGVSEARKNLAKVDPQAQFALAYFDEAKKLLTLARK